MPLYAIHTFRKEGIPDEEYIKARFPHRIWQFGNEDAGRLLGAGPLSEPAPGSPWKEGFIVIRCENEAEARALADTDPYHVAGISRIPPPSVDYQRKLDTRCGASCSSQRRRVFQSILPEAEISRRSDVAGRRRRQPNIYFGQLFLMLSANGMVFENIETVRAPEWFFLESVEKSRYGEALTSIECSQST